jgi:hypothetical protein
MAQRPKQSPKEIREEIQATNAAAEQATDEGRAAEEAGDSALADKLYARADRLNDEVNRLVDRFNEISPWQTDATGEVIKDKFQGKWKLADAEVAELAGVDTSDLTRTEATELAVEIRADQAKQMDVDYRQQELDYVSDVTGVSTEGLTDAEINELVDANEAKFDQARLREYEFTDVDPEEDPEGAKEMEALREIANADIDLIIPDGLEGKVKLLDEGGPGGSASEPPSSDPAGTDRPQTDTETGSGPGVPDTSPPPVDGSSTLTDDATGAVTLPGGSSTATDTSTDASAPGSTSETKTGPADAATSAPGSSTGDIGADELPDGAVPVEVVAWTSGAAAESAVPETYMDANGNLYHADGTRFTAEEQESWYSEMSDLLGEEIDESDAGDEFAANTFVVPNEAGSDSDSSSGAGTPDDSQGSSDPAGGPAGTSNGEEDSGDDSSSGTGDDSSDDSSSGDDDSTDDSSASGDDDSTDDSSDSGDESDDTSDSGSDSEAADGSGQPDEDMLPPEEGGQEVSEEALRDLLNDPLFQWEMEADRNADVNPDPMKDGAGGGTPPPLPRQAGMPGPDPVVDPGEDGFIDERDLPVDRLDPRTGRGDIDWGDDGPPPDPTNSPDVPGGTPPSVMTEPAAGFGRGAGLGAEEPAMRTEELDTAASLGASRLVDGERPAAAGSDPSIALDAASEPLTFEGEPLSPAQYTVESTTAEILADDPIDDLSADDVME